MDQFAESGSMGGRDVGCVECIGRDGIRDDKAIAKHFYRRSSRAIVYASVAGLHKTLIISSYSITSAS
jgi:hypothetical protein